jgi:hypothetical protein
VEVQQKTDPPYIVHDFGGHFSGLDNPPALIEDIREMGKYFTA